MTKKIGILGSTGSIGCNSLEVIRNLRKNNHQIDVVFLSTNSNIKLLFKQIQEFKPEIAFIFDKIKAKEFLKTYKTPRTKIISDNKELIELVKNNNYDTLINSLVGYSGLEPTIEAIKADKKIALANKETMVIAGKLINELLQSHKSELYPIDSEHSAIFQCLAGEKSENVTRVFLTASGGPFRNKSRKELEHIKVEEALRHPNWKMGKKITIDSATMMNKGLEVIEARWLFNFKPEIISVLIHPQSIIHSMIEFKDGSIKAQLGVPDMKIPIQYSLTYPERVNSDFFRIDFRKNNSLTFEEPDFKKFDCLKIAYEVLKQDNSYTIVMNASNEIAVNLFLKNKIKFTDIPKIIRKELENHKPFKYFELEHIVEIDKITRLNILTGFHS